MKFNEEPKKHILIICWNNIFRSVVAAWILNKLAEENWRARIRELNYVFSTLPVNVQGGVLPLYSYRSQDVPFVFESAGIEKPAFEEYPNLRSRPEWKMEDAETRETTEQVFRDFGFKDEDLEALGSRSYRLVDEELLQSFDSIYAMDGKVLQYLQKNFSNICVFGGKEIQEVQKHLYLFGQLLGDEHILDFEDPASGRKLTTPSEIKKRLYELQDICKRRQKFIFNPSSWFEEQELHRKTFLDGLGRPH